jgi:hypothetical protein
MIRLFVALTTTLAIGCVTGSESGNNPNERAGRTAAASSEAADAVSSGGRAPAQRESATSDSRDVCALLAPKELTNITGIEIERAVRTPNGCEWYANAAAQQQKSADNARTTLKKLTGQEPKSASEAVRTMEDLLKGVGGAAAPTKPLFAATVHWHAGDGAETMLKGTVAANGAGLPNGGLERIDGLGDRAFIGAMGMLFYVRKGPTLILFGAMGITREQEIALARKFVSRL